MSVKTEQPSTTTTTPQQTAADSNAAFEAGFKKVRTGESPAPAEKPATTEAPKVETVAPTGDSPTTEEKPVVDEWEGVSPKVKAELESLRGVLKTVEKVPDQLKNIHAHIGGLTTATKDLRTALASAKTVTEAKGAEAPTKEEIESAAKSDARWKQLTEDFPDWAEAVNERLKKVEAAASKAVPSVVDTSAIKTEITTDVDQRISKAVAAAEAKAVQARVYARIDLVHGDDWEERINSPEFEAWYGKQTKDTQALSSSPKAADAIKLLDLYEADRKKALQKAEEKAERDKRLESAITPKGVVHTPTVTTDDQAFERGFNKVRKRGGG